MIFIEQFLGFTIGILSSWLFLYIMLKVKPRIQISPFIAHVPQSDILLIRIINSSRRQATDIHVQLRIEETFPIDGSVRRFTKYRAKLRFDSLVALDAIQNWEPDNIWKLPIATHIVAKDAKFIVDLLSEQIDTERKLSLTLSANDSISGTKHVQRILYDLEDIKEGRFASGKKFQLVSISNF